jgi:dTMP kinase
MNKHPRFIAFEGIDGSGKSTQAKRLAEYLENAGTKVHLTFEPSNGPVGTMIRTIMKGGEHADDRTIAGLFVADRLDHILNEKTGMLKQLKDGFTVVTDRYYFSSYAYHGTHMDMQWVINANAMSASILKPDITIFIDVSPKVSMQRVVQNREGVELYESIENLTQVRAKYFEAFDKLEDSEYVVIIDGNRSQDEVFEDILSVLNGLI